jgi:hypothetical protein
MYVPSAGSSVKNEFHLNAGFGIESGVCDHVFIAWYVLKQSVRSEESLSNSKRVTLTANSLGVEGWWRIGGRLGLRGWFCVDRETLVNPTRQASIHNTRFLMAERPEHKEGSWRREDPVCVITGSSDFGSAGSKVARFQATHRTTCEEGETPSSPARK